MSKRAHIGVLAILLTFASGPVLAQQVPDARSLVTAAGNEMPASETSSSETRQLSPKEKMQRRFPQPARAGDLIGLPLLDDDDNIIGHIRHVVRTPAGEIQLIVTYGGFLGWGQRLVAVPIEVVAIAGRQLASLDMTWAEFDKAPTWNESLTTLVPSEDLIRVALYKR